MRTSQDMRHLIRYHDPKNSNRPKIGVKSGPRNKGHEGRKGHHNKTRGRLGKRRRTSNNDRTSPSKCW